ncbi:GNAT family N-acetyltransferase [Agrococcus citreus]|uniref:GNAT family N-acetyltransferase n=1 Tax=Agrococcus citreus TaxID=84643 RepID=A0ABN1YN06_9MICO
MTEHRGPQRPLLALRPLSVTDAEAMADVLADPALHVYTGGEPAAREELERRYAVQVQGGPPDGSERWLNLVVLLGEERRPIGYVQATIPVGGESAEIAWVIGSPWQARGFGSRAASLLVSELAMLGIRELLAHIHPKHSASQRVARSLGMSPTETVVDGEVRWTGSLDADACDDGHPGGGIGAR